MSYHSEAVALQHRAEEAGCQAATWHAAALAAGVDAEAVRGLMGAALVLAAPLTVILGDAPPWEQDKLMLSATEDTAALVAETARDARRLGDQARDALEDAQAALAAARAAYASASGPADASTAEAAMSAALAQISSCTSALELLEDLTQRLAHAHARLESVPDDLREVYEAHYRLVRKGRVLPFEGRWLTGETRRATPHQSGA